MAVGLALYGASVPRPSRASTEDAPVQGEAKPPRVALLRFGDGDGDLRERIRDRLEASGAVVRSVALDLEATAQKVGCTASVREVACFEKIAEWLAASPKTGAEVIVAGERHGDRLWVGVFDRARPAEIVPFELTVREDDLVLPVVLPEAVRRAALDREPVTPTADETATLAALDEPKQTPEELAAEREAIAQAQRRAEEQLHRASPPPAVANVPVNLRADFRAFCRDEPRRPRASRDDAKDLRPACARGPIFGYWQPRAYVALALVSGAAATTVGLYAAALGARVPYRRAVEELEAFVDDVGGDPRRDPTRTTLGNRRYDTLAYEVSQRSERVRQRALAGDVMLGVTALLGTVLTVIIVQDRREARSFLREEKQLRAISRLSWAPWVTKTVQGAGFGFRF